MVFIQRELRDLDAGRTPNGTVAIQRIWDWRVPVVLVFVVSRISRLKDAYERRARLR